MDSDAYNHHVFNKPDKNAKKAFSFAFNASLPAAAAPEKQYTQDMGGSNGSSSRTSFLPHAMRPGQKRPSFNQPQAPRIFPPAAHFQTPQRSSMKQEPTSSAGFGEEIQLITPMSNSKANVQHEPSYRQQYDGSNRQHYLPTPAEIRRSTSRAPSLTPSVDNNRASVEPADEDDLDLSDLMNRRIKEAKMVKSQLAEERVLTANLRSQVASSQAENSEIKKQLRQLESGMEERDQDIANKKAEIKQLRAMLAEAQSTQQSGQAALEEKEKQLAEQLENLAILQQKLQESEERIVKVKDTAKRGIDNLGRNVQSLQTSLEQMKHKADHSYKNLQHVKDEVVSLRLGTTEKFKELELFLDPTGHHLLKSVETRGLVQELQNAASDAQRVIDMLRDKLHFLGAQVVEYKEKIESLENMREEESINLARTAGLLEAAGQKIESLAERIVKKEKEDAELAAEGARLEVQLADNEERLAKIQTESEKKDAVISDLHEQNRKIQLDLQVTKARLQDAVDRQTGESERLATTQAHLRSQEQEITALRTRLESADKTEEGLRASAMKTGSKIAELEDMIRSARAAEAASITKSEHLSEKVKTLEVSGKKAKKEFEEKLQMAEATVERKTREMKQYEEQLQQASNRLATLQERFDSQTTTLKLAKEHSGDIQERLLASEKANATKLEANEGKYKADIAVLSDRNVTLQTQIDLLQTKLGKLETADGEQKTKLVALSEQRAALQTQAVQVHAKLLDLEAASNKYKVHMEDTLGTIKTENAILAEQKIGLQASLDRLREDYTKLETLRADIYTEKNTLQETLAKSLEETADLRNLVQKNATEEKKAKGELRDALDRVHRQQKAHDEALAKVSLDFEDRLAKQEEFHSKLLQAESKRAELAEKSFEQASVHVHDLKLELSKLGAEVKTMRETAATVQKELARAQAVETQVKETLVRIKALEAENEILRDMKDTIQNRYKDGQLTDNEKELVNLIMKTTQTMHEQEMVEKENELRRRDNMNSTLQAKIDALESTLAKCLKNQGQEQEGQSSKSMVDLNIWMNSSPLSQPADSQSNPQSRVLLSRTVISDPPSRKASPKFTQLAEEDEIDQFDDIPRPTKKLKAAPTRRTDPVNEKKVSISRTPAHDLPHGNEQPKRGNARKRRN